MSAPVVPRPAATVMLLRDAAGGLEVLLLRRASTTPFVPGAHVFPGGAVEDRDGDAAHVALLRGRDPADCDVALDTAERGAGYWVAAVRECFEEAGVVLGTHPDGRAVVLSDLDRLRAEVEAGERHLADLFAHHGLSVPADRIAYVSHWITPAVSPRRYDTRFFATPMPAGQRASADDWEAVDAHWWRPRDALASFRDGEIELIEPTVSNLELLDRFTGADDAIDAFLAAERSGERSHDPRGGIHVRLPGDSVAT